jgi:hypothetical protein
MGFLDDDSRGFLLSMDLLIALIPMTIIMGMMVADMDNVLYTVQSSVYQSSLERVGADTVNTLIKTSGSPYDWQDIGTPQIVGLAMYDTKKDAPVANTLSPNKLIKLKKSDIQNLVGPGYDFYLDISTTDGNRNIKKVGTLSADAPDVVRIERLVLSSNLEVVSSLEGTIRDVGESRPYTITFQTSASSIENYDYWILVVNNGFESVNVDVNGNSVVNSSHVNQDTEEFPMEINETFLKNEDDFQDNSVTVTPLSTQGASMDVYVIAVPKDTSAAEITYDNIKLNYCRFIFYIWTV